MSKYLFLPVYELSILNQGFMAFIKGEGEPSLVWLSG